MKFKLDENLSRHAADLIRAAGHDAVTVASQGLRGTLDETLFEVCRHEGRALVTLDGPGNPKRIVYRRTDRLRIHHRPDEGHRTPVYLGAR